MNAAQFLEFGVSVSLQTTMVVGAAWGVCRLGRLTALTECRLWHGAHSIILGLTIVAATFPHIRLLSPAPIDVVRAVSVAHSRDVAGQVLLCVWFAGVALATMSLVAGWISAARCLKRCRELDHGQLPGVADRLRQKIDGLNVRVRTGPDIGGPCCWQFHRPYVLLPETILGLGTRELQFIVQHELEHLRQGHPLQLFVQRVVEILFWFHPVIWWSARQAALAREFACDEAVARSRSDIADYLRTLLAVVEHSGHVADPCGQTLSFGTGAGVIARRSRRLVHFVQSSRPPCDDSLADRWWRPAVLLLCGAACTAAWL
ncbi:MAG: M56 family metallopeptidase, partial [Pirellulales bacterium]